MSIKFIITAKFILTTGLLLSFSGYSFTRQPAISVTRLQELPLGSPIYIQILKEEQILELYAKRKGNYQLFKTYPICKFSGGLGPKYSEGDFKSPEGFCQVQSHHLKPDSQYHQAINIGYPNDYDQAHGYSGNSLMIHGACVSIGCYAMTDNAITEIYRYVKTAFDYGQTAIDINIYPFRMTKENMQRHRNSHYWAFWKELQPGYLYFQHYQQPPAINVVNGRYVVTSSPQLNPQEVTPKLLALTKTK